MIAMRTGVLKICLKICLKTWLSGFLALLIWLPAAPSQAAPE